VLLTSKSLSAVLLLHDMLRTCPGYKSYDLCIICFLLHQEEIYHEKTTPSIFLKTTPCLQGQGTGSNTSTNVPATYCTVSCEQISHVILKRWSKSPCLDECPIRCAWLHCHGKGCRFCDIYGRNSRGCIAQLHILGETPDLQLALHSGTIAGE
jgi:hypothetical protein